MRFNDAIELYVSDMWSQGRFRSKRTEDSYRVALNQLCDVIDNRDPFKVGRQDIKRCLAKWRNPNTQRNKRAILKSFFAWQVEEGHRPNNPVDQTRRARAVPPAVYRLTREEAARMLLASRTRREKRAIFLGICAGLRNSELRGLRGRHFARPGWVWVSRDIAKGGRERWVPIIPDLDPAVAEIREHVQEDEYVLPAQRFRDVGRNVDKIDKRLFPCSSQALRQLVMRVGKQAGISAHLYPHLLRHAYGDHIARYAGMRNAQFLLGHAGVGTTETYIGQPTLDELKDAVLGFGYGLTEQPESEQRFYPLTRDRVSPLRALTGTKPVLRSSRTLERLKRLPAGSLVMGRLGVV